MRLRGVLAISVVVGSIAWSWPRRHRVIHEVRQIVVAPTQGSCLSNRATVSVPLDRPYQRRHADPASRLEGTALVEDQAQLGRLLSSGVFVDGEAPEGVFVNTGAMTHSQPVLHLRAQQVLSDIALAYTTRLSETEARGSEFVISSMTRTTAQQRSLNDAGKSPRSAHSFGAAFDISRVRAPKGQCALAREVLGEVLTDFRSDGHIRLVAESDCVHVTVIPRPEQEAESTPS